MEQIKVTALFKINEGKLQEFKQLIPDFISTVKAKDPETLLYDWYLNEERMECVVLEIYADSQSLMAHAGNVGEYLQKAIDIADLSLELYGNTSNELINALSGLSVKIYPFYAGL